jgi:hypothetical protein
MQCRLKGQEQDIPPPLHTFILLWLRIYLFKTWNLFSKPISFPPIKAPDGTWQASPQIIKSTSPPKFKPGISCATIWCNLRARETIITQDTQVYTHTNIYSYTRTRTHTHTGAHTQRHTGVYPLDVQTEHGNLTLRLRIEDRKCR